MILLLSEKQQAKENYRKKLGDTSKWLKFYVLSLIGAYVTFTLMINHPGINQPLAAFYISTSLELLIVGLLIYIINKIRNDRKAFFDKVFS